MTNFDFYFDDNWDMTLENGDIKFATEETILVQRLKSKYQFILGEHFLYVEEGLPYPTIIFEKGTSLRTIYTLFREATLNTDGVEKINSLEIEPDIENNSITISVNVNQNTDLKVEVG